MRFFRKLFTRCPQDDILDHELDYHLNILIEANLAKGLTAKEARRQAILDFGGGEQVKQQLREVHASAFIEAMRANLRAALRFIRRSPSFSATVILTLAFGIGANSAVFSAIDAIVLRPLPFAHGDELIAIHQTDLGHKNPETFVAPVRLEDWNRLNSTFQAISGYYTQDVSLTSGELPEKITEAIAAPRFLQVWGTTPALGRGFTSEEERLGSSTALVSDHFWRTHLHADLDAIGKPIRLGGSSLTVIGVMPASFLFPVREVELWVTNGVDVPYAQNREATWYTAIGRLKPGVILAQAGGDLVTVQSQLGRQFPKTDANLTVALQPLKSVVVGGTASSLWLLYGSVSLLLLIACTNIAALLLARTTERQHEIAVRYSLGASRRAIVGQLLTEVFALALAGSMLGLAIAAGASPLFAALSKNLPRLDEVGLNWRIVAYSLGCAFVATIACGLLPALRGTRRNLFGSMAQSTRSQVSARNPWHWILVGMQISFAVAMLIGSGLLLRSIQQLGRVDPGFDADHVLTLRVSGGWGETMDMGKLTRRIDRTLDGLRSMPGVEAAATSSTIPGNALSYPQELRILEDSEDSPNNPKDSAARITAETLIVSPGYFAAMRIPLLQGEACSAGQGDDTVVVNRSFADRYFPASPAIGHHLDSVVRSDFMKPRSIRGIVGDAREQSVDTPPQPTVYWCFSAPSPDPEYLIRTHGDFAAMADTLRRKIHELEPARSVFAVMSLEDHLNDRLAENRLRTMLLTLFAVTAVALVTLGIYGTISYLGRIRRREVGLRLALGASPTQLVGRFLMQGMRVAIAGCAVGLALAIGLSHLLRGMLYGVSNLDLVTYAAVVALVLFVAALASLLPAMRIVRVNPTEVLREE